MHIDEFPILTFSCSYPIFWTLNSYRMFWLFKIHFCFIQVAGKITVMTDPTSLAQLKLDFLRIIVSHEHYVTLNLPFLHTDISRPPSPTPSISSMSSMMSLASTLPSTVKAKLMQLTPEFRQQHFLTGLLLSDLACVLQTL